MAVRFETIKEQVLVVLYDYMLTSDSEAFFFSLQSIRDGMPAEASGAFLRRAVETLTEDDLIEQGVSDPPGEPENTTTYALTEAGITAAEDVLIAKGWDLADYHPSPSVDRIISRADEPEIHEEVGRRIALLAKDFRESNEASEILGDDKEVIAVELQIAGELSAKDKFRLGRLSAFLIPVLQFIASKFFGSALGEAAKQLINLLVKIS